jgi:CBS domain containing-hemolysin-like protein
MTLAAQITGADVGMLIAIGVLLLILIFFAVAETSLNRISVVKANALAENDPGPRTDALVRLVTHPERFINPVLVTVTFCQTGQAFLTSLVAARLFGTAGVIVGFVLNVVVFFVLSEAMPKTWAVLSAERAALATARLTDLIVSFPPLRLISRGLIGLTNVLLPGKGLKEGPFVSEQELLGIVHAAALDEVIEHEERELIESIIEFGDTVAREVMVPRPDVISVDAKDTVGDALDVAIAHGYSRLPITGSDPNDVIGLAYAKDLIRIDRQGGSGRRVSEFARPVHVIPENKPLSHLMREMQQGKFHLVVVADEYGEVAGIVTLEDCLEELVGEIVDEYDAEALGVEQQADGTWLVDGGLSVHDLGEVLGVELPDDDWDTIGGFIFNTLGHVPELGEWVEHEGWRFTVEGMAGRRIRRVRVVAPVPEVDDGDPDGGEQESRSGHSSARSNGTGRHHGHDDRDDRTTAEAEATEH